MLKFGDFSLKFLKINIRFKISTFKIEYRQNFVLTRKLILFDRKCPFWEIWAEIFENKCQI